MLRAERRETENIERRREQFAILKIHSRARRRCATLP